MPSVPSLLLERELSLTNSSSTSHPLLLNLRHSIAVFSSSFGIFKHHSSTRKKNEVSQRQSKCQNCDSSDQNESYRSVYCVFALHSLEVMSPSLYKSKCQNCHSSDRDEGLIKKCVFALHSLGVMSPSLNLPTANLMSTPNC